MVTESKQTVYTASDGKIFLNEDDAIKHECLIGVTHLVDNVWRWNCGGETAQDVFVQDILEHRIALVEALGGIIPEKRTSRIGGR